MGGKVGMLICILAAMSFYDTGHPIQFWAAIVVGIIVSCSYGIMYNFAMELAKSRRNRLRENMIAEGREKEEIDRLDRTQILITPQDANATPNWSSDLNMVATLIGLILLVWGGITRFL